MAGFLNKLMSSAFRPFGGGTGAASFEAAGHGRRLSSFQPSKNHINAAIQAAGPTLLARARWLYKNDGLAGQAVDEWASQAVGDGVKPRPRIKAKKEKKRELLDLFWRWTEEADVEGLADFFGLQGKIARETFLAGECFVRIFPRRPSSMLTVPFQLQVLPAEMLDPSFDGLAPVPGNYIRMGIEFDPQGRRVAYHFWRWHPYDNRPANSIALQERVRVPASEVIHVVEAREAGQLRGVPRIARVLVKIFGLEAYDDAELERKKTTALHTAFLIGRGETPYVANEEAGGDDDDGPDIAPMEPGAIIDLGDDRDIKFNAPAEVGGSYEPFQYRNLLKVAAGLGIPYAYLTGDVTKGNFSNVRTDIVRFRRRIGQWTADVLIHQFCRVIWREFVDRAEMAGRVALDGYAEAPERWWYCEWLPARQEWIDPERDIKAEKEAVKAGFKTRTAVVAERGYDREDVDDEFEEERADEKKRGLVFDTSTLMPPAGPPPGSEEPAPAEGGEVEEAEAEPDEAGEAEPAEEESENTDA